jgi:hypothetical protein
MSILTGILIISLYEVSKKLLEKGFDAAWEPVGDSLKDRFKRWAGTDEESKRQTTFAVLVEVARERTILKMDNSIQTKTILQTFDQTTNKQLAVKLAEESGKLILLSDEPDIDQMVSVTQKHLRFEAIFENLDIPSKEIIAVVFTSFLVELRNLLLDEHLSLGEKEVLIELRKIVSHLQPEINDLTALENEYLTKITEKYKYLTMQGISPKIQNRTIGIRMEDVFISLDAVADDSLQEISRVLKMVQTWLVQCGGRTQADVNQVPANIIFDQICEEGGIDHLYYYIGQGYYGYVDLIMEIGSLDSEDYTWEFYDEVTINMDS